MPRIAVTIDEEYPSYSVKRASADAAARGVVVTVTPHQWRKLVRAEELMRWRRALLARLVQAAHAEHMAAVVAEARAKDPRAMPFVPPPLDQAPVPVIAGTEGRCLICGAPYTSPAGPCENGHSINEETVAADLRGPSDLGTGAANPDAIVVPREGA